VQEASAARVWPARIPLCVNAVETFLQTPDDARQSWRIVGGGQSGFPTAVCWPLAEDRHPEKRGTNDHQRAW